MAARHTRWVVKFEMPVSDGINETGSYCVQYVALPAWSCESPVEHLLCDNEEESLFYHPINKDIDTSQKSRGGSG
jgi:hypothetical protein